MPRKNRRAAPPAKAIRFIPLNRYAKVPKRKKGENVRLVPAGSSDAGGNLAP